MGKLHSSRQMSTCPILRRPTIDVRASSASPTHHLRSLSTHGRRATRGEARRGEEANRRVVLSSQPKEFISLLLFLSLSLFDFTYLPLLSFPFLALHLSLLRIVSWFFFFWFAHTLQWSRWSRSFKGLWFLQFREIESVLSMSLFYSLVGRVPDLLSLSDYYLLWIYSRGGGGFLQNWGSFLWYLWLPVTFCSTFVNWVSVACSEWVGGGLDICHRNIWAEVHMLLFSIGTNVIRVFLLF